MLLPMGRFLAWEIEKMIDPRLETTTVSEDSYQDLEFEVDPSSHRPYGKSSTSVSSVEPQRLDEGYQNGGNQMLCLSRVTFIICIHRCHRRFPQIDFLDHAEQCPISEVYDRGH